MILKLDLYIAKSFMVRYGLTFVSIVGLYIIVDAIERIPPISRQPTIPAMAWVAATYYLSHAPLFVADFAAGINLIAGVWTLSALVRRNEFMAMQTSGISARRALLSLLVSTALPAVLIWAAQEHLGRLLLPYFRSSEWEIRGRDDLAAIPDIFVEDLQRRAYSIDAYEPAKRRLSGVLILPGPTEPMRIQAAAGIFVPGGIKLTQVTLWDTSTRDQPQQFFEEFTVHTDLSEDILMRERQVPQLLDGTTLRHLAKILVDWPQGRMFKAEHHRRIADLFGSCGLILLSIPLFIFIVYQGQGWAVTWWLAMLFERLMPLLVFASFYLLKLFAESFLPPVQAVWLPALAIFGLGAVSYIFAQL